MRIISIDPGYGRAGVAILERNPSGKEMLITSSCFETFNTEEFDTRLVEIGKKFEDFIEKYKPKQLAMESLFFGKNKKTAIGVAEMRGVFRFIATTHKIPIFEYNPMTVKSALSAGDKKQIQFMVEKILNLKKEKRLDDEYDAIAIGLTHLALHRN